MAVGKGITIPLTLSPREFIAGIRVAERGLEQFEDKLEGVEDAGDDAADALRDGFRDAIRDNVRQAESLEGAMEEVGAEGKGAAEKIGTAFKSEMRAAARAGQRVEDSMDDIEKEAGQSAKEFGSAFRGDPVEALEEVQSYIAEIVNVKLPGFAGALFSIGAGAAAAAVINFYEKWREEQEKRTEEIQDWRDATLDAFADAADGLDRLEVLEGFKEQLDEAGISYTDFSEALSQTSPEIQALVREAFATGDLELFEEAQRLAGDAADGLFAQYSAGTIVSSDLAQANRTVADGLGDFASNAITATGEAEAYQDEVLDAAAAAEVLEEATDDAVSAVRDLGGEFADADAAGDDYQQTLLDTAEAVTELTEGGVQPLSEGLDVSTQAGLDAKETLRDLAESAKDTAAAQIELDGDTKRATETTRKGREEFIKTAIQLGLTEQEAEDYATQLGLVPGRVSTSIVANGLSSALANLQAYTDLLNANNGRTFTTTQVRRILTLENSGPANDYPWASTG